MLTRRSRSIVIVATLWATLVTLATAGVAAAVSNGGDFPVRW